MSRQIQQATGMVVDTCDDLKESVESVVSEMRGNVIKQIRYYAGEVAMGIQVGYLQIGMLVDQKTKELVFVGEDYALNSAEGKNIINKVKHKLGVTTAKKLFRRTGYRISKTTTRNGSVFFQGVK